MEHEILKNFENLENLKKINADLEILVYPFVLVGFVEAMILCLLNSVSTYTCFRKQN